MRIRVRIYVRKSLKRKKKITTKSGKEYVVHWKYEHLGDLCFVCGMLSHTERYCRKFLDNRGEDMVKEWGAWLRAPPRRMDGNNNKSKWLREEGDGDWEIRVGKDNSQPKVSGAVARKGE